MIVSGTYQGIPLFDWEFSLRGGFEPSRGWCRCFLSALGGAIPKSAKIDSMKEQFDRKKDLEQADNDSSFNSSPFTKPGATVTGTNTAKAPGGGAKLSLPWGDLVIEAAKEADGEPKDTKIVLKNIFWVEAVLEDPDAEGNDGLVRIELADERILWDLGGYVFGDRNKLINEMEDVAIGNILEWNPSLRNPTAMNDISANQAGRESTRPVMDEKTLHLLKNPYTLYGLSIHCFQKMPGPPWVEKVTEKANKVAPPNVAWGAATLAKEACRELLDRYNIVVAPTYEAKFDLYERGEQAFEFSVGIHSMDEVPADALPEKQDRKDSATLDLRPLSIEVVGDKIVEEVSCPSWLMVIKSDGTDEAGTGLAGEWVGALELLDAWGYGFPEATFSMVANMDRHESKAFEDCPPQGDNEESKELRNKRKRLLRQHLYKSFMVGNTFRRFLPMIPKRAEPGGRGKIPANLSFARDAQFYADTWSPDPNREVGSSSLFMNVPLAPVGEDDIAHVDRKAGVITFKNAMGSLKLRDAFAFGDPDSPRILEQVLASIVDADKLDGVIQAIVDGEVRSFLESENRSWSDVNYSIKKAMNEYVRQNAKHLVPAEQELILNQKTLEFISGKVKPAVVEKMSQGVKDYTTTTQLHNLSECTLIEPRILGIWGWERDWGRADDWYRFRAGKFPKQASFPLKVKGLRQYISIDGTTNKEGLDLIAKINADEYMATNEKPLSGMAVTIVGFHPVLVSGRVPEVTFKGSREGAEATTEFLENRFQHGIAGRPPAYATWTVFQKPMRR